MGKVNCVGLYVELWMPRESVVDNTGSKNLGKWHSKMVLLDGVVSRGELKEGVAGARTYC